MLGMYFCRFSISSLIRATSLKSEKAWIIQADCLVILELHFSGPLALNIPVLDMDNEPTDINNLVSLLAGAAVHPLLQNDLWQLYGYEKRPKKGALFNKLFPKKYELENFILKEVLTMSLIDVLNGIKKSEVSLDTRLLISIGVIDQLLSAAQQLYSPDSFMDNLFVTYASFLKCDKSKLYEPSIIKAKNALDMKNFAKFMVGTIQLLAAGHTNDYLLKSDYFKDKINKSAIFSEAKLKLKMPEVYKKYGKMVLEKILNTD